MPQAPDEALMRGSPAYLLGLLVCVAAVHNIDRVGFSVVLENIKRAMALSDTQLGLLAGPAFALLNAAAAIPLARLADRFGRKRILAGCIVLWSGFTSLCGLSTHFAQLVAARASVGFADAAASPVSQSLVAAAYRPARRSGVLAVLIAGSYLGSVLGLAGAGVIAEWLGWRAALVWMGIPGVLLGLVMWLTLEEPREGGPENAAARSAGLGWITEWLPVVRHAVFFDAAMAVASASILGWALMAWLPSFFHRTYGMGPREIGLWMAGAMGVGAAAGTLAGGAAANRLYARAPRGGLWLGFWTTLASAPLLTAAFVFDAKAACVACVIASGVLGAVCMGPVYATIQELADGRTRATVAAVFGVVNTLLGQAIGPLLVGAISDFSARYYGAGSLRFSLEIVSLLGFWPACHLYRLARCAAAVPRVHALLEHFPT